MSSEQVHVVVGASGATGSALVAALAARGLRVRGVSRRVKPGHAGTVELVAADIFDTPRLRDICRDASAVYNCVNPPFAQWYELFPQVVANLIAAAGAAGARLIHADNTWMYGPDANPITEATRQHPAGPLGRLREHLGAMMLEAHERGEVQAVIGRASELYGPKIESMVGDNIFYAAMRGKRAFWPGSLDSPLNPTYVGDFAEGLATLGTQPDVCGQIWHMPANAPLTGRVFAELLAAELGAPVRVGALNRQMVRLIALAWPVARQGAELIYQFDTPYVIDSSKYQHAFGGEPTPYSEGIRETVAWYRQRIATEQTQATKPWWQAMMHYGETFQAPTNKK